MRNFHTEICAASLLAATGSVALARSPSGNAVPVTVDNYNRAQSDVYFDLNAKMGGFSKFLHLREPVPLDKQGIIRPNRDTLYSGAVFDLDAGPVTVTLPDAGRRFMSMQPINEDQYTPAIYYSAGSHTLTKEDRHAIRPCRGAHAGRSREPAKCPAGPRLAGRARGEPAKSWHIPNPQLG